MRLSPWLKSVLTIVVLAAAPAAQSGAAPFVRGDPNQDGLLDVGDAVNILGHLFLGQPEPDCLDSADTDDTGWLDLSDPIGLLAYLFQGGASPPPPFPSCGVDATDADPLDCRRFPSCGGAPVVSLVGRTVGEGGEPLPGVAVAAGGRATVSGPDGRFLLEDIPVEGLALLEVTAELGLLKWERRMPLTADLLGATIDLGDLVLRSGQPPSCLNAVGRAADRGCGRVLVWGDEHIKFDQYMPASGFFWDNALAWLAEPTCGAERTRVGLVNLRLESGVLSIFEARGMSVEDAGSISSPEGFEVLLVQAYPGFWPQSPGLKDWVEAGGALFTMVGGMGERHPEECEVANQLLEGLGIAYDCAHRPPWGDVELAEHPIAAGLTGGEVPFVNGRHVVEADGLPSDVVARIGECMPPEVPDCRVPSGLGDGIPPGELLEVDHDCDDTFTRDTDPELARPELNIIAVYESKVGQIDVHVARGEPMVLVLAAYSGVFWNVLPEPQALIERVVVVGYETPTVFVPPDIPSEVHQFHTGSWRGYGYGNDCGGGNTPRLISDAEAHTGLPLRSFHGCNRAGEFRIR